MKTLSIVLIFVLPGCRTLKSPEYERPDPSPVIEDVRAESTEASSVIISSSDVIKDDALFIKSETTEISSVQNKVEDILKQCVILRDKGIEISKFSVMLNSVTRDINTLSVRDKNLQADIKKLEELNVNLSKELEVVKTKRDLFFTRSLQGLSIAGTLLIALSVFLIMTGNPKAIGGAVAGISLIISSFVVNILTSLTWVFTSLAVIGVLVLMAILGYHLYDYFINKRGFQETVKTVETIKPKLTDDTRREMFGDNISNGIAGCCQSEGTEKKVKELRKKLKV